MKKQRIFIIMNPLVNKGYGIGRYIDEIISGNLHKEIIIIDICSSELKSKVEIEFTLNGNVRIMKIPNEYTRSEKEINYVSAFCYVSIINKYYKISKNDIFHFQIAQDFHIAHVLRLQYSEVKIIYTIHNSLYKQIYPKKNFVFSLNEANIDPAFILENELCNLADRVVVLSNEMKKWIIGNYNVSIRKIRKIPNCINLESKHKTKYSKNKNYLLYTGRLTREKGVDVLINAFLLLNKLKPNTFELHLVGDGYLKESIEKEKEINKSVFLYGHVNPNKMEEYYILADYFVFMSKDEQSSYSVLEAIKYECFLILSDIESFENFKHERHAIKIFNHDNMSVQIIKAILSIEKKCDLVENAKKLLNKSYGIRKQIRKTYERLN